MPLTEKEKKVIEHGKEQGKSKIEILNAVSKLDNKQSSEPSTISDIGSGIKQDVQEAGQEISESFSERKETVQEAKQASQAGEQTFGETLFQTAGQAAGVVGDTVGSAVKGLGKAVLPESAEEEVGETISGAVESGAEATGADKVLREFEELKKNNPRAARNISSVLSIGELAADALGGGVATKAGKQVAESGAGKAAKETLESGVRKVNDAVSDAGDKVPTIRKGADVPDTGEVGQARKAAEETAPQVTQLESRLGITADQKRRLQAAGPQKTQKFIDVVETRNKTDKAPTAMEFAGNQVRDAVEELDKKLKDTGSEIGETRQKLADIEAPIDEIKKIESEFENQLDRLNLKVENGEVVQQAGKVKKLDSQSRDINVLNQLQSDIEAVKQSPKLTNLVDLRTAFDNKIKFGKKAQEVSSQVDPVSRSVRKQIADTMENVVGPNKAEAVDKFARVADARDQLKEFTSRSAGGEYLLRLFQSGRGGEARKVIDTVREVTGKDLAEEATLMRLATDIFGNQEQKTLFQQSANNLGISDILRSTTGDPDAIGRVIDAGVDAATNPERILRGAAEGGN